MKGGSRPITLFMLIALVPTMTFKEVNVHSLSACRLTPTGAVSKGYNGTKERGLRKLVMGRKSSSSTC